MFLPPAAEPPPADVAPEGAEGDLLLGWAVNRNGSNRTRHAELLVLQAWWARTRARLAPGTRLYVTHEPCAMCAGLAWELGATPGAVTALYALADPGPAARETVLVPWSEARRRVARTPDELAARCLVAVPWRTP